MARVKHIARQRKLHVARVMPSVPVVASAVGQGNQWVTVGCSVHTTVQPSVPVARTVLPTGIRGAGLVGCTYSVYVYRVAPQHRMVAAVPTVVRTSHSGNVSRVVKVQGKGLVYPTVRQLLLTVPAQHYGAGQYRVTLTHHGYSVSKWCTSSGQWLRVGTLPTMQRVQFTAWLAAYVGQGNANAAVQGMDGAPVKGMGSVARTAMQAACGSACKAGY